MAKIIQTKRYVIGTADDLGCDPEGGKWVRICRIHQTITNFLTQRSAQYHSVPSNDGCTACEQNWNHYQKQLAIIMRPDRLYRRTLEAEV